MSKLSAQNLPETEPARWIELPFSEYSAYCNGRKLAQDYIVRVRQSEAVYKYGTRLYRCARF